MAGHHTPLKGGVTMTTRSRFETRLTVRIKDGVLNLRLRVRVRWLLALLAAIATITGSPALIATLTRIAS
jgi:hypothetical protein